MKKIILQVAIFLALGTGVFGQVKPGNSSITISTGIAVPLGGFAKKDLVDPAAGFAKTGIPVGVTWSKLTGNNFGFSVSAQVQWNSIDVNAMGNILSQTKIYSGFGMGTGVGLPVQGIGTVYPNWKFDKKSWFTKTLMAGAYGQFDAGKNKGISFFGSLMAGVIHASSPGLSGSSITDTVIAILVQHSSSAFGFAYMLNGGIKYKMDEKFFIQGSLDYKGTADVTFKSVKTVFTTEKQTQGFPGPSIFQSVSTGEGKQKFNTVNIEIGLGFIL